MSFFVFAGVILGAIVITTIIVEELATIPFYKILKRTLDGLKVIGVVVLIVVMGISSILLFFTPIALISEFGWSLHILWTYILLVLIVAYIIGRD